MKRLLIYSICFCWLAQSNAQSFGIGYGHFKSDNRIFDGSNSIKLMIHLLPYATFMTGLSYTSYNSAKEHLYHSTYIKGQYTIGQFLPEDTFYGVNEDTRWTFQKLCFHPYLRFNSGDRWS